MCIFISFFSFALVCWLLLKLDVWTCCDAFSSVCVSQLCRLTFKAQSDQSLQTLRFR